MLTDKDLKKYYVGALFSKNFQCFENGRSDTVGVWKLTEVDPKTKIIKLVDVRNKDNVFEGEVGSYEFVVERFVFLDKKKIKNFISTYEDYVEKASTMETYAVFLDSI